MKRQVVVGVTLGAFGLTLMGEARRADAGCGMAPAGWNVPKGGTVYVRSPGPISAVISAVGEYRTHVMMSHGPGAYVTHETMRRPGSGDQCSPPIHGAELGWASAPGASQTNQGGIYNFIYGNNDLQFIAYQRGQVVNGDDKAARIADWAWATMPYQGYYHDSWIYRLGENTSAGFHPFQYRLYQFMDSERAEYGIADGGGFVCSTFMAYLNSAGGQSVTPNWWIRNHQYSSQQIGAAAGAAWNSVYNDCSQGQAGKGFFQLALQGLYCLDFDLCDEAADQVLNCFTADQCNTDDNKWWKGALAGQPTANSHSPDLIGGWIADWWSILAGPWAWDGNETVQWNSGGNQYGCWE